MTKFYCKTVNTFDQLAGRGQGKIEPDAVSILNLFVEHPQLRERALISRDIKNQQ